MYSVVVPTFEGWTKPHTKCILDRNSVSLTNCLRWYLISLSFSGWKLLHFRLTIGRAHDTCYFGANIYSAVC